MLCEMARDRAEMPTFARRSAHFLPAEKALQNGLFFSCRQEKRPHFS
jgi:hypothetical protein